MNKSISGLLGIVLTLAAGTASAYVGPGAGISVLGALWGLIVGIVMAVGVILFWPIRMMLRKKKAEKEAAEQAAEETDAPAAKQEAGSADAS